MGYRSAAFPVGPPRQADMGVLFEGDAERGARQQAGRVQGGQRGGFGRQPRSGFRCRPGPRRHSPAPDRSAGATSRRLGVPLGAASSSGPAAQVGGGGRRCAWRAGRSPRGPRVACRRPRHCARPGRRSAEPALSRCRSFANSDCLDGVHPQDPPDRYDHRHAPEPNRAAGERHPAGERNAGRRRAGDGPHRGHECSRRDRAADHQSQAE